ncbi:MAG: restriction endonuclease subunit S [Helicobacter sp.]|uniref:restriction endonuclease subunit S n=1 Tax=Helicobacter sp. TaxID=218 RepID=UPI003753D5E3|nr:restriction endonuclease subunit S [Helicobacter sp.]
MQNDLTSVEWREFKISEIFDRIEKGKCKNFNTETKTNNKGISFLSATINNNGTSEFVDSNTLRQKGNCIMFINQGDGGAGYSVYKYEDFISTTSNSFGYAKWINKYTGLFVACILCRFKYKYSFGYGRTEQRLKNDKIMLPIDSKGNPNWQFMENYMKNIEQKYINNIVNYYNKKLANDYGGGVATSSYSNHSTRDRSIFIEDGLIKIAQENLKLENIKWKEFSFDFVFKEIKRGKRLIKDNQFQGKTPYVSSSALNNGVDNFINNSENIRKFSNCISLANSGSVGSAFFHSYEFVASDHVTQLIQPKFSKYVYLFLLPIIARLSEKYSFNREINDKRINREKLLLPIDSKGNPDYALIESYMKNIEYRKIQNIIKYYKNKY